MSKKEKEKPVDVPVKAKAERKALGQSCYYSVKKYTANEYLLFRYDPATRAEVRVGVENSMGYINSDTENVFNVIGMYLLDLLLFEANGRVR